MTHTLTITLDDDVWEGLVEAVGEDGVSVFLNALARPHVVRDALGIAYRKMTLQPGRENEAEEWIEAVIEDAASETVRPRETVRQGGG